MLGLKWWLYIEVPRGNSVTCVPLMTLMARPAIITLFLIKRHFFLSPCIWHISKKFIFPHWKTKHLAVGNFRDK